MAKTQKNIIPGTSASISSQKAQHTSRLKCFLPSPHQPLRSWNQDGEQASFSMLWLEYPNTRSSYTNLLGLSPEV